MGKLKLDDCVETKFIKNVQRILQRDETLSRIIKYWDLMDGKTQVTNVNQLPCLAIYPMRDGEGKRFGNALIAGKFPVAVQITVEGTDCTDLLNLWNVVRLALNDDRIAELNKPVENSDGWVIGSTPTQPAYFDDVVEGKKALVATGVMEATVNVRTKRAV